MSRLNAMKQLVCILTALAIGGCEVDDDPGRLAITWRTAGQSCEDGAITDVRASLFNYDSPVPMAEVTADCDAGRLVVDNLPKGGYSLLLEGLQGECWTHAARREDIYIRTGLESTVENVPLDRRARDIAVHWPFADGGACVDYGIEQVEVSVVVRGSLVRMVPSLCRPGALLVPGVAPGPLSLTVLAYDVNGTPIMEGSVAFAETAFDAQCEEPVEAEVELSLCDGPSC